MSEEGVAAPRNATNVTTTIDTRLVTPRLLTFEREARTNREQPFVGQHIVRESVHEIDARRALPRR